ncbi:hypothetical protein AVEN_86188-1 [Araneus ventricosus]|uniref:Uncharacterized protein n=1 Tax=Araneus ventricosus TaxID=182803 RepID=A0A4Y2SY82_ARAVE|nr:hypothetical protein AVEN_86188-1 [Araneus ventricosus]
MRTDLVILNLDQTTTSTVPPPTPNLHATPVRARLTFDVRFLVHQAQKHGGSLLKSGVDPPERVVVFNSIDTGPSHTSLQAKDDSRPNVTLKFPPLLLSVMDFTPSESVFFVRVARPDEFGEEGSFLRIRTMPAVIVVFEGEREFPLSLIEELGRSRILRSLYFNGIRNQRVKAGHSSALHSIRPKTVPPPSIKSKK